MLDAVAAQTAPATLPRAIEVSATDDCTVDGRTQRKSRPVCIDCGRFGNSASSPNPTAGNNKNVAAAKPGCSRQFIIPAGPAERDKRAPWRKNSAANAQD